MTFWDRPSLFLYLDSLFTEIWHHNVHVVPLSHDRTTEASVNLIGVSCQLHHSLLSKKSSDPEGVLCKTNNFREEVHCLSLCPHLWEDLLHKSLWSIQVEKNAASSTLHKCHIHVVLQFIVVFWWCLHHKGNYLYHLPWEQELHVSRGGVLFSAGVVL